MPELPEVEAVSRSLGRLVSGKRISAAELIREKLVPETDRARFANDLVDSTIDLVRRRGKHILIELNNGRTLITHLRMTGRFSLLGADDENPKHTHAIFYFLEGDRLVFDDQRHFGLMKLAATDGIAHVKELKDLAPEPFSDEFSKEYLRAKLRSSKRSLKEFLLDQTKVCGLGNIYASEAMFLSGAHPEMPAYRVSARTADKLHENIIAVLTEAIDRSSKFPIDPKNFEASYYSSGNNISWRVYDRESSPCLKCRTPLTRIKQAGRSTYFCRRCQRK